MRRQSSRPEIINGHYIKPAGVSRLDSLGLLEQVLATGVPLDPSSANRRANYFRQAPGPGWALVGDAGHHKDPLVGRGTSDAFSDAELLAEANYPLEQGPSLVGALNRAEEAADSLHPPIAASAAPQPEAGAVVIR